MKKIIYSLLLLVAPFAMWGCDKEPTHPRTEHEPSNAAATVDLMWTTSAKLVDATRKGYYATFQGYANNCSSSIFKKYLAGNDELANALEKHEDIYAAYKYAFDRVLEQVKTTTTESGSVVIWHIYNMGYIVKTPTGCFGVDIYHRHAAKLAPYLDFLCITHNHQDHYTASLVEAMLAAGKPVLSNYLKPSANYQYTSKVTSDYTIGKFKLHTFITNHNNDAVKNINITVFQISCGDDAGDMVLLHAGDSNFRPEQYDVTAPKVNVMVSRYAPNALDENKIIGQSVKPDYVLLSHIQELSHSDSDSSRWTFEQGLTRAGLIDCANTWMPFWGERFVWKNNELK